MIWLKYGQSLLIPHQQIVMKQETNCYGIIHQYE